MDNVQEEKQLDTAYLGAIGDTNRWMASILLCGVQLSFKTDTGVEVTVISLEDFKKIKNYTRIQSTKVLYGPSNQVVPVMGEFKGTLQFKTGGRHNNYSW